MTEDEMVGRHYRLNLSKLQELVSFEQAPGVGDGQRSLECFSLWGHKDSDMTE